MPPERSGIADYCALLLPALRERIDIEVVRRGRTRPAARRRRRALPRRQRPGRARLDRRRAAQAARRRRPPRLRPPSPRRRTDDRPEDGHGYLDAMERERRRRRSPARLRRARQADPAALGDAAGGLPARRRGARPRHRADRPLALRRASARARRATTGRSGGSRIRPGRVRRVEPARVDGRAAVGCFGHLNASEADSAAARGVRAGSQAHPGARCCSSGPVAGLRPRPALQRLASTATARPRGLRRRGPALGADGRVRRPRHPALADDGRDLGQRRSGPPLGKPLVVSDVGWFRSCPTTSR